MAEQYDYPSETAKEKRNHIVEIIEENIKSRIEYYPHPNLPKTLIKYYECNQNNLNVLIEKRIWATNPLDFNDPYDCSPQLWEGQYFPFEEIKEWLKNVLIPEQVDFCKNINQLRELFFNTVKGFIGIYCLNENRSCDLFWAHYADNHHGFQINFREEILSNYWEKSPLKIEYLDIEKLLEQRLILQKDDFDGPESIYSILPRFVRWITIKKKEWEYENEWRYLFWVHPLDPNPDSRKQKFPLNAIQSITLGFKFFDNAKPEYIGNGTYKYTYTLEDNCGKEIQNISFEIIKCLQNYSIRLYQIALNEEFKLYEQRIYIKQITKNAILIVRKFDPEQLREMDVKI
jgi:hypothetical protein